MSHQSAGPQVSLTFAIETTPNPVDAGAELTLSAKVSCDPPVDLTGDLLEIFDSDRQFIGQIEFTHFDEETSASEGSLVLFAPTSAGDYSWSAELPAFDAEDLSFEASNAAVNFSVKAHAVTINVWDAPSAISLGQRFSIKVGMKCSCGCSLAGRSFSVHDQDGGKVGEGMLGSSVWPNTQALYFAQVDLAETTGISGLCSWQVRHDPDVVEGLPHSGAKAQFGLTFVPHPEHAVRVEVIDRALQTPLAGALVIMHPYRATTDKDGVAELRVAKGGYTLFVSAQKYVSDRATVEIDTDLSTRAELAIEVRRERA